MNLAQESCQPAAAKLSDAEVEELSALIPDWTLEEDALETELEFESFADAIDFVNQVAEIAEKEDHHPEIYISHTDVGLSLTTHRVGGLTRNDFVVAAKIDLLFS